MNKRWIRDRSEGFQQLRHRRALLGASAAAALAAGFVSRVHRVGAGSPNERRSQRRTRTKERKSEQRLQELSTTLQEMSVDLQNMAFDVTRLQDLARVLGTIGGGGGDYLETELTRTAGQIESKRLSELNR